MPWPKDIQEQMRNKIADMHQSGKGYKPFRRLWDFSEPRSEPLSTKGENLEQWWTFPGVAGLPKLLQEHNDNSSRRSYKNPEQHLKNCRPNLPQFSSVFMIQQ